MAFIRTVKTASGATAVQVVWSWRRGSRSIDHIGSAHDEVELAALKTAATARLSAGQTELDLGLSNGLEPGTLPITSSQMTHLWDGLCTAYRVVGFESVTKGDNVFRDLVLARIIEPATARHARLGPASLVLYDVSTLYFETDAGDGFREPGFSKERRLEPQITLGLLTDATGFPLTVAAFEGNRAETATMLPVINAFKTARADVKPSKCGRVGCCSVSVSGRDEDSSRLAAHGIMNPLV